MESVQDRVLKIREALQTKSHLEAARLIAEAKRAEQKRLKKGLEFDLPPTHFTKYLRVGLCTRLHERNIVQRLPQSIETLYELSLLKPATWSELVGDEAKLKPTLTRREVRQLRKGKPAPGDWLEARIRAPLTAESEPFQTQLKALCGKYGRQLVTWAPPHASQESSKDATHAASVASLQGAAS